FLGVGAQETSAPDSRALAPTVTEGARPRHLKVSLPFRGLHKRTQRSTVTPHRTFADKEGDFVPTASSRVRDPDDRGNHSGDWSQPRGPRVDPQLRQSRLPAWSCAHIDRVFALPVYGNLLRHLRRVSQQSHVR